MMSSLIASHMISMQQQMQKLAVKEGTREIDEVDEGGGESEQF